MAAKPPRKPQAKQPARKPAAVIKPVPVPPVAAAAPVLARNVPVAAIAAVESVARTISDIREVPASLTPKGKTMVDTIQNVKQQGEKLATEIKDRAETVVSKGKAILGDANDFNKGNLEAMVESGKIAAKGFEKLGQDQAEYVRRSFEQTTSAFKGMAGVKSPTELMKLHSDYVRTSFDGFVAQASHNTEAMLKLAGEIAQPLSNRFAVAAEKVKLAA